MERYLVTGGAGFIGSHLVEALLAENHFVRVLDNFDTGSPENLRGFSGNLEIMEGSVEDDATVSKAVEGIDYVLHQAARGSVPRSVSDPRGTHQNNVTGTLQVLRASQQAGVKRVVCASSSSVYGETAVLPKEESMVPDPCSPYAASKQMQEIYCRVFHRAYGLETVALRYFNIFGPRQNPNLQYAAVIPSFIRQMKAGRPCTIYGDGEQTRDFTYVADCVRANLLACRTPGISGQVCNIACGRQTRVNQLFQMLKKHFDYDMEPVYAEPRPGDVKHSYASTVKTEKLLHFQPHWSLEEGLEKTVLSFD